MTEPRLPGLCRELSDALRKSVGVAGPALDSRPLLLSSGLRGPGPAPPRLLATLDERWTLLDRTPGEMERALEDGRSDVVDVADAAVKVRERGDLFGGDLFGGDLFGDEPWASESWRSDWLRSS